MVGGPKGITKIYVERMLAAHNIKPGGGRFRVCRRDRGALFRRCNRARSTRRPAAAVQLLGRAAGFANLGLTVEYAPDLPFSAAAVNTDWAKKSPELMRKLLAVHNKSVAWFLDPKNRQEAIDIMVEASKLKPEVITQTYDFLHSRPFIEGTGRVSKPRWARCSPRSKG